MAKTLEEKEEIFKAIGWTLFCIITVIPAALILCYAMTLALGWILWNIWRGIGMLFGLPYKSFTQMMDEY